MRINEKVTRIAGFTLIEMLLVMVIVSTILFMGLGYIQQRTEALRIDKATLQMQQILNASLAFYVNKGEWPQSGIGGPTVDPNTLMGTDYIPPISPFNSPWGIVYYGQSTDSNFYVIAGVVGTGAAANAQVLAGRLGLSYTTATVPSGSALITSPPTKTDCDVNATTCYVVASVTIPGQNLNNATSVNYTGLYRNGGCVQVPICPSGTVPQIFVVPASVHGTYDSGNPNNVYPLSSFTAYATGTGLAGSGPNPTHCSNRPTGQPYTSADSDCFAAGPGQTGTKISTGDYWRVCLSVITEKGVASWGGTNPNSGLYDGTVLAITRCSLANENVKNSGFNVYAP
ncbi:MAG: type II secretion system protein [Gammaproteobacteria bacterium]